MNTLTRYNPFQSVWDPIEELEDVERRMSRFLRRSGLGEKEERALARWNPAVDISEDDVEFLVKVELPNVKKEDVKVTVEDNVLQITGERKFEKEENGRKYHRVECSYGTFSRSFTLPETADEKKINADYKDGVLSVHIGKGTNVKSKSVEVKVS